jgi:ABC-type sugar transport system substrate-binding protein
LTAAQAERFRHAGANAIIAKPVSAATLTGIVKEVLAKPRPFIESAIHVGHCRRAGIVASAPVKRRRQSDEMEKTGAV